MNEPQSTTTAKMPWFSIDGENMEPFIIGIAGASASGKTSVSHSIIEKLGAPWVTLLCMDSFYNALTPEQIAIAHRNEFNFDHPSAFDHDKLYETLLNLKKGKRVEVPVYDFSTHSRLFETVSIYGAKVIIFEGIFALYDKKIRDLMDMRLFVDSDADVCLGRRLKRDIAERGRDLDGVLAQYTRFVKPSFDDFIGPSKKWADIIIPRGLDNTIAIDVITKHVRIQLDQRDLKLRSLLIDNTLGNSNLSNDKIDTIVIPQTAIVFELQNQLSDINTKQEKYVTASNKLADLVIDEAIKIKGDLEKLFSFYAVNILNGGIPFLISVLSRMPKLKHGSITINNCPENDPTLGEVNFPDLHALAPDQLIILLLDDQIKTGATALMAIRVLLDHNVAQESIIFCSLFSTPLGICNIHRAFPQVKIVTGTCLSDRIGKFLDGFGSFTDRYFKM